MFNTPVLFLIFNRPTPTQKVFEKIRKSKPAYLYIAADGWRENKPGEKELCLQTRAIIEQIDWQCEVKTLFRENNMGCGRAVSSAITWFFENVEQGIILEDDCLPEPDFFNFCEDLLERYKTNDKVMHISGSNFQLSAVSEHSYFFTSICFMWGWATWRRAWKQYDFEVPFYNRKSTFSNYVGSREERLYWHYMFSRTQKGLIDTWDYQWYMSVWYNHGLGIMPQYNLVKNIGFGEDATHTKEIHILNNLKTYPFKIESHPDIITRNKLADNWTALTLKFYRYDLYSLLINNLKIVYILLEKIPLFGEALTKGKAGIKRKFFSLFKIIDS